MVPRPGRGHADGVSVVKLAGQNAVESIFLALPAGLGKPSPGFPQMSWQPSKLMLSLGIASSPRTPKGLGKSLEKIRPGAFPGL